MYLIFAFSYDIIVSERRDTVKEDKLGNLSMELSVEILKLTKELHLKHESVISNQIGRSATSVCDNITESKYRDSCADFIAKPQIER